MARRAIFYDTETTGVRPDRDRIIELAAFDPFENRTFSMLIHPGCPIPAEATAIHKISDEMVKEAPSFREVGPLFAEFCQGDTVLIAHNNDTFDQLFLNHEYSRNGLEIPSWRFLDSLKWARRYRSDLPRHTLQFLREVYQIGENNAHRAMDDVVVLQQVFAHMTDDLTIEEIERLMSTKRPLHHMPFGKHQGKPLKEIPVDYVLWLKGSGAFDKTENQELKSAFQQLNLLPA